MLVLGKDGELAPLARGGELASWPGMRGGRLLPSGWLAPWAKAHGLLLPGGIGLAVGAFLLGAGVDIAYAGSVSSIEYMASEVSVTRCLCCGSWGLRDDLSSRR